MGTPRYKSLIAEGIPTGDRNVLSKNSSVSLRCTRNPFSGPEIISFMTEIDYFSSVWRSFGPKGIEAVNMTSGVKDC